VSEVESPQIAGLDVSRETWDRLLAFEGLVRQWNPAINLISRGSLAELRERHVHDSAQLFRFCPTLAHSWVDVGSGGGFPGIVVAILAKELRPDLRVTMVESDLRKATFLRQAVRSLRLSAEVLSQRIETIPSLQADVLSARALAPLGDLLAIAERHLKPGGLAIFPKGERHGDEIAEARRSWDVDIEVHQSQSQPDAAILMIKRFERAQRP
jgi:16S rRNA (guanine527-N7)-methyltransferase